MSAPVLILKNENEAPPDRIFAIFKELLKVVKKNLAILNDIKIILHNQLLVLNLDF